MCSYNDDDGWVYNDDDYADYEDYLNGDDDEAIEKVLEDVVVEDDEPAPDIGIDEEDAKLSDEEES